MGMIERQFIEELSIEGKRVLIRVDFNVPLDEDLKVKDIGRINSSLETIRYIINNNQEAGVIMIT